MKKTKINNFTQKTPEELLEKNLIVKHVAGSHAYKTNTPTSDIDHRGVFFADEINIRTPFFPVHECVDKKEKDIDTKYYELTHFIKLCVECNPNIVETLWIDETDILFKTTIYDELRAYREKLLSKKIAFTTSGYAYAQLARIKGHKKWIMNPCPKEPPKQTDFISLVHNFTEQKMFKIDIAQYHNDYRLIPYGGDIYGLIQSTGYKTFDENFFLNTTFEGDVQKTPYPLFIVKFNKDIYKTEHEKWQHYWEWKKNRNKVRSELEEKMGFDGKHAMHCIRLLRTGAEALETGKIIVKRPDAPELLKIRNGAWSYEQMMEYAEHMDNEIRNTLYKASVLPKYPDIKDVANFIMYLQDISWSKK